MQTEAKKVSRKFAKSWEIIENDEKLKVDLFFLCNYLQHNIPQFSAAGFFAINRHTLLSILGTSVTYVIVDIQLRNSRYAEYDKETDAQDNKTIDFS